MVEDWLTENPFTQESEDEIHYRFYVVNLENISIGEATEPIDLIPYVLMGVSAVAITTIVIVLYRKFK